MAFSSWDELISMSAKDPNMARDYVNKARQAGKSPVDANNPGFSQVSSMSPTAPGSINKPASVPTVDPRQQAVSRRLKKTAADSPQDPTAQNTAK